jgi:hypothetical protein
VTNCDINREILEFIGEHCHNLTSLIFKADELKTGVDWTVLSDLIKTLKLQHLIISNQVDDIDTNEILLDTIAEHCSDLVTFELCDSEQFKIEKLKMIETKCIKLQKMTICSYYQNRGQKLKTKITFNKSQKAVENHTSTTVEIYNGTPWWGNNEHHLCDLFYHFPEFDRIDIVNCNTFTATTGEYLLNNNSNLYEIRLSHVTRGVTSNLIRDLLTKNTQLNTLTCQLFNDNIDIYTHENLEVLNLYVHNAASFSEMMVPKINNTIVKQIIEQCPKLREIRLFTRHYNFNDTERYIQRENPTSSSGLNTLVTFREVKQEFFWEELEWQREEEK